MIKSDSYTRTIYQNEFQGIESLPVSPIPTEKIESNGAYSVRKIYWKEVK